MAWTNPRTWVAGELVTAAQLNAQLRDNLVDLDGRAAQALTFDNTQLGNASGTAESILHSYTLPANTLDTNGKTIQIRAIGVFANTGSYKKVKIRVGGLGGPSAPALLEGDASTLSQSWYADVTLTRIASNSQRLFGLGGYGQYVCPVFYNTIAVTDTAAINLVVTGECVSGFANEVVYLSSWVQILG